MPARTDRPTFLPIRLQSILCLLLWALACTPAHAEFFGLLNGRTADLASQPQLSVEAAFITGDFGDIDYEHPGIRLNYKLSDEIMLYGDVGRTELADNKETSLGAGFYYQLPKLFSWAQATAFKASFHRIDTEGFTRGSGGTNCGAGTNQVDPFTGALIFVPGICTPTSTAGRRFSDTLDALSFEVLFSGDPIEGLSSPGRPAHWYANAGVHNLRGRDTETELGFGGGVVVDFVTGKLYGGVDHIDELIFGIGYRHFIK